MTVNTTDDRRPPRCGECSKFAKSRLWCPIRAMPRRMDDNACEWGRSYLAARVPDGSTGRRKPKHKGRK